MIVTIRRAELRDCNEVFEWRNDATTRQMARSSEVVLWEDHLRWYKSSLANENQLLLICEGKSNVNHCKLGIVRFDFIDETRKSLISINLSPNMRGKGYAKECLMKSISYMTKEKPKCKIVNADIKKINEVSKILFEQVGFKFVSEDSLFWQYQLFCSASLR